jgi:hypothetical protein
MFSGFILGGMAIAGFLQDKQTGWRYLDDKANLTIRRIPITNNKPRFNMPLTLRGKSPKQLFAVVFCRMWRN